MQTFSSAGLRGGRISLSAYVKTQLIRGSAYMWLRADGPGGKAIAWDDMNERKVSGITDWTRYDLVLEVPPEAHQIACGVVMAGKGRIWVDDVCFQSAGKEDSEVAAEAGKALGFE